MRHLQLLKHDAVEGLRVGRFKYRINTTCIVYRIGSTLIDSGPANQWKVIHDYIKEKGIKQILLTHHHEDHGGNAGLIQEEFNIPVFVSPIGIKNYTKSFKLKYYEQIVWGNPRKFKPSSLEDEIMLENGMKLKVIPTPGHSEDMTCFLEPNKGWLFTGDLFIASKPKFIREDENPNEEIKSLKRILTYDFDKIFCSHRGYIADGKRAIRNKLEYLESLRENVHNLYKEGRTIEEITNILMGKENFISIFTLYHFSKRNIVLAFTRTAVKNKTSV